MNSWNAARVAAAAGATLIAEPPGHTSPAGPAAAAIDSRRLTPGSLFVGLSGERADGGRHAGEALRAGAWGVLVAPEHARTLLEEPPTGAVLAHENPLAGLQTLARAWRRELGAKGARVVAITGSVGKTSTKDILAAMLGTRLATVASPENLNTEIGLPLAVLAAGAGTEALVLELAMRGPGQIAELCAIAEPDVGVIVNVGPAHLEQLGSIEAIAAAKAELIAGLAPGASIVVPAGERLLEPHLRAELRTITFGDGGEVSLLGRGADGTVLIRYAGREIELRPSFHSTHQTNNLLAAVAAAGALGVTPSGALEVQFSALRGQRHVLQGGVVLINDCYNANPMSMRAAIDDLAATASGRRVAVLGDMLELGPDSERLHREIGVHARARGVGLLLSVGPLAATIAEAYGGEAHSLAHAAAAAEMLPGLLCGGDTVLVKGSRGVGLELIAATLAAEPPSGGTPPDGISALSSGAAPGRR